MMILRIGMDEEEIRETLIHELWWNLQATFPDQETYDGREVDDVCAEFMAEVVEFSSAGVLRGSEFLDLKEPAITYVDQAIDDFANNGGHLDQLPAILTAYEKYCDGCRERGIKFVLALDPAESYVRDGFANLCDCDGIGFARLLVDVQAYGEANWRDILEHGHGH
jgi:hypothetical protein